MNYNTNGGKSEVASFFGDMAFLSKAGSLIVGFVMPEDMSFSIPWSLS